MAHIVFPGGQAARTKGRHGQKCPILSLKWSSHVIKRNESRHTILRGTMMAVFQSQWSQDMMAGVWLSQERLWEFSLLDTFTYTIYPFSK